MYDFKKKWLRGISVQCLDQSQDISDLLRLYQILEDKVVDLILENQELRLKLDRILYERNLSSLL